MKTRLHNTPLPILHSVKRSDVTRWKQGYVNFNANKSNLVIYDMDETEDDNNKINFPNSNVNVKPNAVHLGNIVGKTNKNDRIDTCLSEFNCRLNILLTTFKHVHGNVKYTLFKTYCMPLYRSQIWICSSTICTRFITNWYKAVRRIFNLPPMCHRRFVYQIAGDMPIVV